MRSLSLLMPHCHWCFAVAGVTAIAGIATWGNRTAGTLSRVVWAVGFTAEGGGWELEGSWSYGHLCCIRGFQVHGCCCCGREGGGPELQVLPQLKGQSHRSCCHFSVLCGCGCCCDWEVRIVCNAPPCYSWILWGCGLRCHGWVPGSQALPHLLPPFCLLCVFQSAHL